MPIHNGSNKGNVPVLIFHSLMSVIFPGSLSIVVMYLAHWLWQYAWIAALGLAMLGVIPIAFTLYLLVAGVRDFLGKYEDGA